MPDTGPLSSRAQRGGGFTFEVQQLSKKYFSRGLEAKAFSRSVVVGGDAGVEGVAVDGADVCVAGQEPSQTANGVLNGALLPGCGDRRRRFGCRAGRPG